jgi:stage III sporulation protein AD
MIKIAGIVFITLMASIILRDKNKELALLITICGAVILFSLVYKDLYTIAKTLESFSNSITGASAYISLMLKILIISLLSQFVSDICRDSGENALANQSEIASKIIIIILTLPLFESVINIVTGLLK